MADPFVAEIRIYPFNFAPKGWAFCNGQLLPLSQNTVHGELVVDLAKTVSLFPISENPSSCSMDAGVRVGCI